MTSVAQQAFDTEIFGLPFYRVMDLDQADLERDLPPLLRRKPVIVDAKVPADRSDLVRFLLGFGFRSVCTQVTLVHDLAKVPVTPQRVDVRAHVEFDAETLHAHVANFQADRFARDPLIHSTEHDRLYERWIENSLARMQAAVHGRNFCSFAIQDRRVSIDLLSVLDKKQGIGRNLVSAVLREAARQRKESVAVVTECGNEAAWRLYLRCGFRPDGFTDCLHFVSR
jgi:GNAT superfamily N-acetyltransferase